MRAIEVAERLPAMMPWALIFDLDTFGALIDPGELRRVFLLSQDLATDQSSHVILSPHGRLLAPRGRGPLIEAETGQAYPPTPEGDALADRLRERFRRVGAGEAGSLGIAQPPGSGGVAVTVTVDPGSEWGRGIAVWDSDGADALDGLLAAIGIHKISSERINGDLLTRFRIHVPTHIQAGRLSSFERADHCTWFFLRQGRLDEQLQVGLALAARSRVQEGRERALRTLGTLATRALRQGWAMLSEPPSPAEPFDYVDLAPLGIVLRALRAGGREPTASALLAHIESEGDGGLWPCAVGSLRTATDTGLIALGLEADELAASGRALRSFRAAAGGYVPQLWAESAEPGRMPITDAVRHWCQADYATTALVALVAPELAADAGAHLADGFDERSGLYFANPFLVDWVLAEAVGPSGPLRDRLLAELLAAMHQDHSFGTYDEPCSTALGILALAALGYRGRTMRMAQLRLLDLLDSAEARGPESVPFYQSLRLDPARMGPARLTRLMLDEPERRIVSVAGQWFALTWFRDSDGLLLTSLAALALAVPCESAVDDPDLKSPVAAEPHPRYLARTPSEYITRFALAPYVQ